MRRIHSGTENEGAASGPTRVAASHGVLWDSVGPRFHENFRRYLFPSSPCGAGTSSCVRLSALPPPQVNHVNHPPAEPLTKTAKLRGVMLALFNRTW